MTVSFRYSNNVLTNWISCATLLRELSPHSAKSFPCRTYKKSPAKSFSCHTSEIIGLKVLYLPHLRKKARG